jgi:AraC family transcriptional activator FtrA
MHADAGIDRLATPHEVVAIAYDGLCTFEFGIVVEAFALPRPEFDFPWYRFRVAAVERPIRAMGGFSLQVDAGLDILEEAQTVVIPGWRNRHEAPPPALIEALQAAHRRGARLLSICSGAFVLAAAGLLEGRRATTHWRHAPHLADACPGATLVDDVLYVEDDGVVTSAGSSAGIDACLHLIRADHGTKIANIVARRLVMPPHRDGGQAQYVEAPIQARPGRSIAAVLDWARQRLSEPLEIGAMARHAGLSERTFLRRFRDGTGVSPLKWLRRERIGRAMKLLEESDMALVDIGTACGFASPESFRKAFFEIARTSPAAYRNRFRR